MILGGPAPTGRTVALDLRVDGHVVPSVTVTVAGRSGRWVMDTGADTTAINTATATAFGLAKVVHPVVIQAVSCKTTAQPVEIPTWSLGHVALPGAVALSSPNAVTAATNGLLVGAIGENVMASFGSVTFGFASGKLTLGGP